MNKNSWKEKSKDYIYEIENFLDILKKVENEILRKQIIISMLRCDNELTIMAERLFDEYYKKGYEDCKINVLL
jgi:hypothetical protein